MCSGTVVFNFGEITLSLLFYQKIISNCKCILDKYLMKMTDHHATSSCSQESGESTKPAYKEIE